MTGAVNASSAWRYGAAGMMLHLIGRDHGRELVHRHIAEKNGQ
jgi:transcriptional regulator GlxA family with amidase domain